MRSELRWMFLLALVAALFFWKILLTDQFSILTGYEFANCGYAWNNFAATSLQHGTSPLWDPYTFSGFPFPGEMQQGLFYPLKLLLYFAPLSQGGALSQRIYEAFYILSHLLALCFMFFLAREMGLRNRYSAFIAAICFGLGGFVGSQRWPNILDSAIWLPLVFLCFLRALKSENRARGIFYACAGGLCLGTAVLAGSLHPPMVDAIVVATAGAFFAWQVGSKLRSRDERLQVFGYCALMIAVVGVVSFAAGAVQLLPSIEYSRIALRWASGGWAGMADARIPYYVLNESSPLPPRALFAFLFGAASIGTGEFSPYLGVMPLLLAVIGVWRNWEKPWVKYLAVLGGLAFFYTLASYSLLHGLLYVLVPYLDAAREAGRFIYLTHFSMALLAGFGVESLFSDVTVLREVLPRLNRVLLWIVIVAAVALGIPVLLGKPDVNEWNYAWFLFLISSWATLLLIRVNRTGWAQFALVAVILCDLSAFNWTLTNKMEAQKSGEDYMTQLLSLHDVAKFLNSQGGLFRVHMWGQSPPNIGDIFKVQSTLGCSVSMVADYPPTLWSAVGSRLLNVRFIVSKGDERKEPSIYTSGVWKVSENPSYCPRAWVVQRYVVDSSPESVRRRMQEPGFDPLQVAFVNQSPAIASEAGATEPASVSFVGYQADKMDLAVKASRPGFLVLSEIYYPGWQATVNGKAASIYVADGVLRGVTVPGGESRVVLKYRPRSFLAGAFLTVSAFLGTFIFAVVIFSSRKPAQSEEDWVPQQRAKDEIHG